MSGARLFFVEADASSWEVIREALRVAWASSVPSPSMSDAERASAKRERVQAEACLRLVTATLREGRTRCDLPLSRMRFMETACAEFGWLRLYAARDGQASADDAAKGREAFAMAALIARTINRDARQELLPLH